MAKYNVQEFAELIKTEYPDYADMDDLELTKMVVSEYPEYEAEVDVETTIEPVEGDDKKKKLETTVLSDKKRKAIEAVYQERVNKIKNSNLSAEQQEKKLSDLLEITNKLKNKYKVKAAKEAYAQELFNIDAQGPGQELITTWEQQGSSLIDKQLSGEIADLNIVKLRNQAVKSLMTDEDKKRVKEGKRPLNTISQEQINELTKKLYAVQKSSEWKVEKANELLENYETDFGVDRTADLYTLLDEYSEYTPIKGVKTIYKALDVAKDIYNKDLEKEEDQSYWDYGIDLAGYISGTRKEREYLDNKKDLYNSLKVKEKELDEYYSSLTNKMNEATARLDLAVADVEKYEKRIKENDPTFTQQDYDNYKAAFNDIKEAKKLYNENLALANDNPVNSDDFETIKNLTLKTYDNLQMVENNIVSSAVGLASGVSTVYHELRVPELLKWAGVDIETEEGLNSIFGESEDGVVGLLKGSVRRYGDLNELVGKTLRGGFTLSDKVKERNAPIVAFDDIETPEDFAMWGMDMMSGQVVNTALTIAIPPAGLILMSAGEAGRKMNEMNIEIEGVKDKNGNWIVEPKDINAAQYFATAALYGGIEYVTEKVSLGILTGVGKNVSKAFKVTGKSGPNISLKNLTTAESWGKFGLDFTKNSFKEAGAEGLVTLVNNATDIFILGKKDIGFLDGMTESMLSGFLMGNTFQVPAIAAQVAKSFSSEGEYGAANKLNAKLLELSEARDKEGISDNAKEKIQGQIDKILKTQFEASENVKLRALEMTPEDRQDVIDKTNNQHKIRRAIDELNADPTVDENVKALTIDGLAKQIQADQAIKERIFSKYGKAERSQQQLAKVKKTISGVLDTNIIEVEGTEDVQKVYKNELGEDLSKEEADKLSKDNFGMFLGKKNKDGKRVLILNKSEIEKFDAWTSAQHEVLHEVLSNMFKGDIGDNAYTLANSLKEKLSELDVDIIENSDLATRIAAYNLDQTVTDQVAAEEVLTLFSEALATGDIKFNEGFFTKIKDILRRVLQNISPSLGKVEFNTAEDVYNFIKDYNKSIEKERFTTAQKTAIKEGVTVSETLKEQSKKPSDKVERVEQVVKEKEAIIKDFYADQGLTTEASKDKASKNIANETQQEKSKRQDKRNVDVAKVYDDRAKGKNKQEWNEFLDSARGGNVMGDLIQQYYPDMVATAIKQNAESPVDVASEAMIPLMQHIRAFDPSINDDLAGYIGGYLGLKVGTAGKKVAKKTATISMEQEGVRQVAEKQGVEQTSSKEAPVRKGIVLADRLRGKAKEAVEKIESKVNTKALIGAKEIGPITKEEQIEYLENQTYKSLKDLVSDETQEMFGITPKPGNLTKQDIKNAQMFIASNVDALISMLPEGSTPSGTATGVQKVLLDSFYTKRDKKVKLATTGSKAGLKPFVKNSNIDPAKFLEIFGITQKGEQNLYKKESNTSSRIKALVEQTGRLITNQTVRQAVPQATKVGEGKSKVMFSKKLDPAVYAKIANVRNIKAAVKQANIKGDVTINNDNRVKQQEQFINDIKTYKLNSLVFLAGSFASSGAINDRRSNGDVYYKLSNGKEIKGIPIIENGKHKENVNGKKMFLQPTAETIVKKYGEGVTLVAQRGRLYYGTKDPAYKKALKAAQENDTKETRDKAVKLTPPREGVTKKWVEKNAAKSENNMEVLESVVYQLNDAVAKGMPANIAAMVITQGYQATSGLIKISAPFLYKSKVFEFGLGKNAKQNANDKPYREEHNPPASVVGASIILAIANNQAKDVMPAIKKNYYQTQLSKADDTKLDQAKLDATLPEGQSIFDNPVNRLIDAGINLNSIVDVKTGKTLAEIQGVGVPKQFENNSNVVEEQGKIIKSKEQEGFSNAEAQKKIKAFLPLATPKLKASKKNLQQLNKSKVVKTSDQAPNSEDIRQAEVLDKALNIARDPNAPVKKIRVFDFDDTLARTKSNVLYTMPDGTTGKLTAEEFAKKGDKMLAEGAVWDFSEFNKVMEGREGPLLGVAKLIQQARGTKDVFVLTARAAEAAPAIKEFLDSVGLNIPIENITGLGDSSPLAKSNWIVDKAADGYNDFYFADDHLGNVDAVKIVLDVIDVKSKVQQAKVKFSKNVDQVMNNIIFQKTGIEPYKEFAQVTAQARGRKKKSWNLIPPSAQDFGGLLYNLLGKGEVGNQQWQWMQDHLIKPYGRAMNDLSVAQNQLMADFRALKESLSGIPKNLKKEAFGGFTNEDVVRVATWDRQGIEVDGISKRDLDAVRKYVATKPDLNIFIDQLVAITKGDGYYYPGKNWLAGTITTDFREGLRKVTRKNLLEEWQSNIDLAFNESTMNKLEAAFGPKYREALENSLERMSSGQNRRQGMSRIEQRFLDYINNSVGAVMFLNARSAVLQTISAANFINWKDNNPIKAGIAFANQPQYWSDFMKLMNSDFLVDRRNGLKINVSESEIAEAAKTSKNTVKGVITYLLNKGFAFTQIADSFAIATGGATFYRNRIKTYKKEGLSEAEATEKAFLEFRELAEESQQSARADKISQQQASTLGRLVLAFANTPSQYARIMEKAGRDLINNRGDWKANISKIAYYGFVQNLLFTTLQSALFAYGMDDDEEEDAKVFPESKMLDTANSMADNILRGLGVAGVVLAQSKNTIIDLVKRSERDPYFNPDAEAFPGPDYEDAVMKLLAISPPVSIKLRKIRGGITDWYFNRWRPEASEPFNINNPSYRAGSKVIAGVTNVPLDRLFQKMENIQGVFDDTNPTWQRVFMALGWPKWQLETEKEKEKRKVEEKEQKRNIRAKDKPSIYTKDEQVNILKQYKLTDEEIKELKNEDLRVKKIQQLRDSTKVTHVPMAATVKPKAKATPVNIKASLTPKPKKTDSTSYKPSGKVKPTPVSIPKKKQTRKKIALKDRTKRQARLYRLKKSDQLDTLKSLGLSGAMLDALKYEEDRVRKIEELYDKNK